MRQFEETCDWLVIGCGGGSMVSALVMRQAGKSITILEKSAFAGGTTAKSGGVFWVPNNRFMRSDKVADTIAEAETYLDAVVEDGPEWPGTSREKRHVYVSEATKMVDFLVEQGIKLERAADFWPDYYSALPGASKTSRGVTAKLFDTNELGPWRDKLRRGFLPLPVRLQEGRTLPYYKRSWQGRLTFFRVAVRTALARLRGRRFVSAGAALQGRMLKASLQAGVDIRLEHAVTELIIEDGRALGVVATRNGEIVRFRARLGILVNAGGFSRNQAMRDRYLPGTRVEWSQTNECDTGDMHEEIERIGGTLAHMDQMVGYQFTPAPGWEKAYIAPAIQSVTAKPHAILVDQAGVRYLAEGGSYEAYCEAMLAHNETSPAIPSWAIFDSQYIEKYMLGGTMPGGIKPVAWSSENYLKQATSVEALASLLDIGPATLKATVDRWNGFVDRGVDEDFHRGECAYDQWLGDPFGTGNKSLGRIDKAPFYAVSVIPGDVGTLGGAVTDLHGRVLHRDGMPFGGLYATGCSSASVTGGVYPGAGASVGPSMAFGYIAARHALGNRR